MRDPKEIEYSFLGCIFDNPSQRIPEAQKLKANANWFSDQACCLVWTAIESLRKKTSLEKINTLVIIEEATRIAGRKKSPFYGQKITTDFIDEAKRFREATSNGKSKTLAAYAPILQDASIGRQLDESMEQVKPEGKYSSNSERILELAKQIQRIQKDESPESGIDVSELLDNMMESYERGYDEYAVKGNYNYVPGIPYPWDSVSHLTEGLTPGLHIIAARPSVGKTSFILQCMNFWCDLGYKVAFDCMDMSLTEMIKRPVANLSLVPPRRMKFGWADPDERYRTAEAKKIVERWGKNGLLTLTLEHDVDKLKSWAEIRHRAGKLDILVIDFAQRFRLKGKTSEYEIVTYVSGVLKQLVNECLMPVILLSQLSRDNVKDPNGKRPPELSDLRGSGALEQDATSVILLHKEMDVINAWRQNPPAQFFTPSGDARIDADRQSSVAAVRWNLAKNQNGQTGEIPFVVFQNCFRWYMGNEDADKGEMYQKILADWRFLEEPFVSAERNDAVVYPDYWPQKCAEVCGQLGLEIPSHIKEQLSQKDITRYEENVRNHRERMETAKESASKPIDGIDTPPSFAQMAKDGMDAKPAKDEVAADSMGDKETDSEKELNRQLDEHIQGNMESDAGGEPTYEDGFEDSDF